MYLGENIDVILYRCVDVITLLPTLPLLPLTPHLPHSHLTSYFSQVSQREMEIRSKPNLGLTTTTDRSESTSGRDLSEAIESLPDILSKKANLEAHTNILQARILFNFFLFFVLFCFILFYFVLFCFVFLLRYSVTYLYFLFLLFYLFLVPLYLSVYLFHNTNIS